MSTMALWVLGQPLEIKLTGEQTGGVYAATEAETAPGFGPPPHVHHREDEAVYVVDGEFVVTIDGEEIQADPGTVVHIPKGLLHTHRNVGTTPGKILTFYLPAGFEKLFEEVGEPIADRASGPSTAPDPARLRERGPAYGLEVPVPARSG